MTAPRRSRRNDGQSMVEFALVAPIFLLLIFGVIQLGLIFGAQNGLVNGVREAARRAATYRINDGSFDPAIWGTICSAVAQEVRQLGDRAIPAYNSSRIHPSVGYSWQQNPETGHYFLVADISATYDNPLYVPLVSFFLDRADGVVDNNLTLSASEEMRVENPALEYASAPAAPPACP